MTIRLKIIALLLGSLLVLAVGISLTAGITALRFTDEQFSLSANAQLDRVDDLINSFLKTGEQVSLALSEAPEAKLPPGSLTDYTKTKDATKLDPAALSEVERRMLQKLDGARTLMPSVEIALFGMQDGGYIKSPATIVGKGYDPRTRPWYKDIIEGNKDRNITDPYVSSSTKTLVTTVSARVKDGKGATIGVAGVDFILGDLTDILRNARVGRTGYLLLFDRNGRVMLDPKNPGNLMKPARETNDAGLALLADQAAGMHVIERGGVEFMALSRVLENTGWKAVMVMERSEEREMGVSIVANIGMVIGLLALAIIAFGILMARGVTRPLTALMGQVNEVARGNFDALNGPALKTRSPEVTGLFNNLSSMVGQIRELIASSAGKAEEAEAQSRKAGEALREAEGARREAEAATRMGRLDAARQLESIVGKATEAARTLDEQIRQATAGSDAQLNGTERARAIVAGMSDSVELVARDAGLTEEKADATRTRAEQGSRIVNDVVSSIGEVNRRTQVLSGELDELGRRADGIGQIMNVISDIADQTNLLALNAAIEAARAGDAGRGFAVVADEVRKLAEKTMTATKEVGDVVTAIQKGTAGSIASMSENGEIVNKCSTLANEAGDALRVIVDVARSTAEQVQAIARSSGEQARASEALSGNSEEVGRIARDTADSMLAAQRAVTAISGLVAQIEKVVAELKR